MSDALDLAKKAPYLLVDFAFGAGFGTHVRYTNWSADVVFETNTYTSLRTMSVDLPTHTGGSENGPCKIELPKNTFTAAMASGLPHSPCKVTVRQVYKKLAIDTATGPDVTYFAFRGDVKRSFRNINGRSDSIRFEALDVKASLSSPIGLPMLPECEWTFAGEVCGVVVDSGLILNQEIVAIEGTKITLDSFPDPGVDFDFRYTRGYVEFEGLRVEIRKYTRGFLYLFLAEQPPTSWLNATVLIHPGCTKQIADCTYWNNIARNGATGIKSPDYQPMFEDPQ